MSQQNVNKFNDKILNKPPYLGKIENSLLYQRRIKEGKIINLYYKHR